MDYVSQCGLAQVDMPMDRSPEEVLVCLQELSQDNEQIAEIYKQHSRYSDDMLKALANNPEMADFVMNSLDRDARPACRSWSGARTIPFSCSGIPGGDMRATGTTISACPAAGPPVCPWPCTICWGMRASPRMPWPGTAWTMAIMSWAPARHGRCWRSSRRPAGSAWSSLPPRSRP